VRNEDVDEMLIRIMNLLARIGSLHNDWSAFFRDEISLAESENHTFTNSQIDFLRTMLARSSAFEFREPFRKIVFAMIMLRA
jgi:hypothetical protein